MISVDLTYPMCTDWRPHVSAPYFTLVVLAKLDTCMGLYRPDLPNVYGLAPSRECTLLHCQCACTTHTVHDTAHLQSTIGPSAFT